MLRPGRTGLTESVVAEIYGIWKKMEENSRQEMNFIDFCWNIEQRKVKKLPGKPKETND